MQDILSRLPPGFRFLPTDEELIRYYLHRKVHGRLTPEEADVIKLCNLYGEGARPPCEIFKLAGHKGGDDALYFFTILIKKTLNSSTQRMSRTVGTDGGTWHGDGVEEVICRLDNTEFKGTKRRFRYQNKQRPDQHGCWTLLEYGSESISENVVICKLKISEHGLKESRKRKRMDYSSEGVCLAGDNAVTPENAAPAVSAIPAMGHSMRDTLENDPNWFENHQGLMGTNFSMEY